MTSRPRVVPLRKDVAPAVDPALWRDGTWTVAEAAEFLKVHQATVYRLMQSGGLPWAKVRGSRRLPKAGVMAWLAAETKGGQQ